MMSLDAPSKKRLKPNNQSNNEVLENNTQLNQSPYVDSLIAGLPTELWEIIGNYLPTFSFARQNNVRSVSSGLSNLFTNAKWFSDKMTFSEFFNTCHDPKDILEAVASEAFIYHIPRSILFELIARNEQLSLHLINNINLGVIYDLSRFLKNLVSKNESVAQAILQNQSPILNIILSNPIFFDHILFYILLTHPTKAYAFLKENGLNVLPLDAHAKLAQLNFKCAQYYFYESNVYTSFSEDQLYRIGKAHPEIAKYILTTDHIRNKFTNLCHLAALQKDDDSLYKFFLKLDHNQLAHADVVELGKQSISVASHLFNDSIFHDNLTLDEAFALVLAHPALAPQMLRTKDFFMEITKSVFYAESPYANFIIQQITVDPALEERLPGSCLALLAEKVPSIAAKLLTRTDLASILSGSDLTTLALNVPGFAKKLLSTPALKQMAKNNVDEIKDESEKKLMWQLIDLFSHFEDDTRQSATPTNWYEPFSFNMLSKVITTPELLEKCDGQLILIFIAYSTNQTLINKLIFDPTIQQKLSQVEKHRLCALNNYQALGKILSTPLAAQFTGDDLEEMCVKHHHLGYQILSTPELLDKLDDDKLVSIATSDSALGFYIHQQPEIFNRLTNKAKDYVNSSIEEYRWICDEAKKLLCNEQRMECDGADLRMAL